MFEWLFNTTASITGVDDWLLVTFLSVAWVIAPLLVLLMAYHRLLDNELVFVSFMVFSLVIAGILILGTLDYAKDKYEICNHEDRTVSAFGEDVSIEVRQCKKKGVQTGEWVTGKPFMRNNRQ